LQHRCLLLKVFGERGSLLPKSIGGEFLQGQWRKCRAALATAGIFLSRKAGARRARVSIRRIEVTVTSQHLQNASPVLCRQFSIQRILIDGRGEQFRDMAALVRSYAPRELRYPAESTRTMQPRATIVIDEGASRFPESSFIRAIAFAA
jgi:hypothetical protein